ncbi:hypothetical protein V8F20_012551 [Naviculisporaceae sp. PSN 640]
MIQTNLNLPESTIIPDAFIHLPEQLGGLGLRNPFVPLLLVRDNLSKAPEELLSDFLREEYEKYLEYKKTFDETPSSKLRARLKQICPDDDDDDNNILSETESEDDEENDSESDGDEGEDNANDSDSDSSSESNNGNGKATPPPLLKKTKKTPAITTREATKFMTLDEFCYFREHTSLSLRWLYRDTLLAVPSSTGISLDKNTTDALHQALSPSSSSSSAVHESNKSTGTTSGYPRRGGVRGGRGAGRGGYNNNTSGRGTGIKDSSINTDKKKAAPALTPENKWFVALYADELLQTYGGLSLVDKQFLPGGVLSMMREKKVTWQMVL